MAAPIPIAGAFAAPAAFLDSVFGELQPLLDALVEDAAAMVGHAFNPADVRWLEVTPNGSSTQHCRLMWQEKVLFEMQVSGPSLRAHLLAEWPRTRH